MIDSQTQLRTADIAWGAMIVGQRMAYALRLCGVDDAAVRVEIARHQAVVHALLDMVRMPSSEIGVMPFSVLTDALMDRMDALAALPQRTSVDEISDERAAIYAEALASARERLDRIMRQPEAA